MLDGVDLAVGQGEFVSLLGPSGCGKTTLLRIVAGLAPADSGSVTLDGRELSRLPPHKRDVGVVFQSYALFPHLTVAENIAFGLKAKGAPAAEIAPTVARFLDLVHMASFADRSVKALSGGQQQRVAVARALAVRPKLLLLDEPFSALDRKLRETMQIELRRLLRELGTTAIFVTHDQDEALIMSDRIAVMNRGRIEQYDAPDTIYRRPATAFALEFVGLSTRIPGRSPGSILTAGSRSTRRMAPCSARASSSRDRRARRRAAGAHGLRNAGRLERHQPVLSDIVFQGARIQAHFESPEAMPLLIETSGELPQGLSGGAPTPIAFSPEDTMVFPLQAAA